MNQKIKQYLSNFFKKHTLLGFIAFLLALNGFSITFIYFIIEYFFPDKTLILELIYFTFWLNFFVATYLILFSFTQKNRKKIFTILASSLVLIPLIFFNFFDYVEIIKFWAESITLVSLLMLVSTLYIKFKNHPFMKVLYATYAGTLIYLGFKFQIFQTIIDGMVSTLKIILLFFTILGSLFFNIEPTPNQKFEDFFAQPVPKEVKKIRYEDQSLYMLWGYGLYSLDFQADKKFLDDLAKQTKFPKKDNRNEVIHKIKCDKHLLLDGETCYKGVIYPYVHNITYHEQSKDLHDSISYYGELSTW